MRRSTLTLETSTPLGKEESKKLMQVVQSLLDDPEAVYFAEAVDWQAMGLLDYPGIVKNPMDLGTVKRNLLSNRYTHVQDCLDDLQLVWDCCRLYNGPGSWIMMIAVRLEKQLRRLVKNYLPAFNLSQQQKKVKQSELKSAEKQSLAEHKEPKKQKIKKADPPPPPPPQKVLTNEQRKHEQRNKFMENLHLLTKDQLAIITLLLIKKEKVPEWKENRLSFKVEEIDEELMDKVNEQMDLWGIGRPPKKTK